LRLDPELLVRARDIEFFEISVAVEELLVI